MNAYRGGGPRPSKRELKRLAKRIALAQADPAPMVWYKPWTWGRAAKVTLAADPFYLDESRNITSRARDLAPDAIWRAAGESIRARSRDAVHRDPHAASIIDKLAGNLVGTGIHVEPNSDRPDDAAKKAENARLSAAFKRWAEHAFVGGWSFAAGTEQAAWAWAQDGEVLAVRQWRPDLLPGIPMRVKLIEADLIDSQMPDELRDDGSKRVDGIEIDKWGEVSGYWLLPEHPKSQFLGYGLNQSKLVPASDVAHLFTPRRVSQRRGLGDLAPVLDDLGELDDYENAEGMRKTLDSCIMGVVEPGANEDIATNAVTGQNSTDSGFPVDVNGNPVGGLMQGSFVVLRGGKKISFHQPAKSDGYEEYKRSKLRSITTGARVMYEHLGDLSQVNYSSYRAGNIEFRRSVNARRANYLIPRLHARIWSWFVEGAFAAGLNDRPICPAKWTPPRWESVDPAKDAAADLVEVMANFASHPSKIAARGKDPQDFIAEKKQWEAAWKAAGFAVPTMEQQAATMARVMEMVNATGDPPPAAPPRRRESRA